MPGLKKVYKTTFSTLKNQPSILVPFAIFACLELIALTVIYLAPRMPLRTILGPPIKTFWGERFLHYPHNFLLLSTLNSLSKMFLTVVFGSALTGAAVALAAAIYHKKEAGLAAAFKTAFKKYISLFIIVLLISALFYFFTNQFTALFFKALKHSHFLYAKLMAWRVPILITLNYLFALITQAVFVYAIPALIIDNEKLFASITRSFRFFREYFIPTIVLTGLPMLLYLPIIISHQNTIFIMDKLFPEFVLFVLISGVLLSSLVIDPIVTLSTTYMYLMHKDTLPRKTVKTNNQRAADKK